MALVNDVNEVSERPGPTSRMIALQFGTASTNRAGPHVEDAVATEEPLEIRLLVGRSRFPVAVTMRTPGNDFELAAGFLFSEGVVKRREQVARLSYCVDREVAEEQRFNIVNVHLAAAGRDASTGEVTSTGLGLERLERHFMMTSACGVCGKATLEALHQRGLEMIGEGPALKPEVVVSLPEKMRRAQKLFDATGGVHAAGLFSPEGELLAVREDVGRHNAMDKLVGWAFLGDRLPLASKVLVVSGRASFELVQKAVCAGAAALCAVSAPSNLAVQLAREFGLTLAGFVRPGGFKVYSGAERLTRA